MLKGIKENSLTILFLGVIGSISLISCLTLAKAYIKKTPINNQVQGANNELEADFSASIFGEDAFLNLNGAMRRLLGQREMNDVIRLDNDYLISEERALEDGKPEQNAAKLRQLQDKLESDGIQMLYVLAPFNLAPDEIALPAGETDNINPGLTRMYTALDEAGVHSVNLRDAFAADAGGYYAHFYRTDMHWNAQGAFCAYRQIMAQLQPMLGVQLPQQFVNPTAYTVTTYPHAEFGSYGHRTGLAFAGDEDFDLIEPGFATCVTNLDTGATGAFSEVLVDKDGLEHDLKNVVKQKAYDRVFAKALGHFEDEAAPCNKKIMVVGDSMMKGVVPFLAITFQEVQTVDAYHVTTTLTREAIDDYKPDVILFIHHSGRIYNDECYDFGVMAE